MQRSATCSMCQFRWKARRALARRARGTPRVANRLLKRARDFAEVRGQGSITDQIAADALEMLDIDHLGLDDIDRRILRSIVEKFGGGPVGIDTLAAAISEETDTVMDVYEPYLIQLGFLQRTPRGRVATEGAYTHLGIKAPAYFQSAAGSLRWRQRLSQVAGQFASVGSESSDRGFRLSVADRSDCAGAIAAARRFATAWCWIGLPGPIHHSMFRKLE